MERLLVVDVHDVCWRLFVAGYPRVTKAGRDARVVSAVVSWLRSFARELKISDVVAVGDSICVMRRKLWPSYRNGGRPRPPEYFEHEFAVMEYFKATGWWYLSKDGASAGDLVASFLRSYPAEDTYLWSASIGLSQLVSGRVYRVWRRKGSVVIHDEETIRQRLNGVSGDQIAEWRALVGDVGEGIPGVDGVSANWASRIICEFGGVDRVLEGNTSAPGWLRERLERGFESYQMSVKLARLRVLHGSWKRSLVHAKERDVGKLRKLEEEWGIERVSEKRTTFRQWELPLL